MSLSRLRIWLPILLFVGVVVVNLATSRSVLERGQVVKQFYAHSITQSLRSSGKWLETSLPCASSDGSPRHTWVEEVPIFHQIASWLESFELPGLAPAIISILFASVVALIVKEWFAADVLVWAAVVLAPIHVRYFSQHMPDVMSVLWTLCGLYFWLRLREKTAFVFWALAIATKALAVFPIAAIVAGDLMMTQVTPFGPFAKRVWAQAWKFVLACVPFALWLWIVRDRSIPSPFHFSTTIAGVAQNRHSGAWSQLIEPTYWSHFVTWVIAKGVGIPLFAGVIFAFLGMRSKDASTTCTRLENCLWSWAFGLVPYWIFVRSGNYTHDYYTLQFSVPLALLGARYWTQKKLTANLQIAILAVSMILGCAQIWSLFAHPRSLTTNEFCQSELSRHDPN